MKATISFCLLAVIYDKLPLDTDRDSMSEDDKPLLVNRMP